MDESRDWMKVEIINQEASSSCKGKFQSSYWRSSFDGAQSVISRFSTTFALISSALIDAFILSQLFCPGSATASAPPSSSSLAAASPGDREKKSRGRGAEVEERAVASPKTSSQEKLQQQRTSEAPPAASVSSLDRASSGEIKLRERGEVGGIGKIEGEEERQAENGEDEHAPLVLASGTGNVTATTNSSGGESTDMGLMSPFPAPTVTTTSLPLTGCESTE
ncbi:hypothetical protein M9H77_16379 [Catharanthus roseus]|uniref:Uncharacterized protein n=1 Tax=Catharanthus roseus TaxID=4058 RepID=A0ACC0B1L6_CATRO|nr:hypothetical protein M9H77_16379 [Catharanthus roseus]